MSESEATTVKINGFPARIRRKSGGASPGFLADFGGLPRWMPFLDRLAERPGGCNGTRVIPGAARLAELDKPDGAARAVLDWTD